MSFNLTTFIFELLNFVILALILQRVLYRPLHRALDKRREQIEQVTSETEAARLQATTLQQQLTGERAALGEERRRVLAEAHDQALTERARLLEEAEHDAQQRRAEATKALERERQAAWDGLRTDMVALSVNLSARLLQEACDANVQRQLAGRLIAALARLPEREPTHAGDGKPTPPREGAVVETARELDEVTLAELRATVATVMGQEVPLAVTVKPALLGGLRLLLDGRVWDATLAGQLEEVRRAEPDAPA